MVLVEKFSKVARVALLVFMGTLFPLLTLAHETAPANTHYIHLTESGFEPSGLTITAGDTVIFENVDTEFRWPASNIHPTHSIYPEFDPLLPLASGEEWSFSFLRAGEWKMHDHLIPEFTGVITVLENPDLEVVVEERENVVLNFFKSLMYQAVRLYYAVFPDALDTRMANAEVLELADNQEGLEKLLHVAGPRRVMEKLIEESDGGNTLDCHSQAHVVGRTAYELFGASVYTEGSASCHSGFYHGVMEAFIFEKGTEHLIADIESLCDSLGTAFDVFECYHGVGHGMMAYEDYDLPMALKECGRLTDDYNRGSCYGGVFMENIVAGQGNGADGAHETTWLRNDDPIFPCNAVGDDPSVLWNCYAMQTSWMLEVYNRDFEKVAEACLRAEPADMIDTCYMSFGRDSAGIHLRDADKIIAACKLVPDIEDYEEQCVIGGLYVILDFWGPDLGMQGEEFCEKVDDDIRAECRHTVAVRKADLN